MATGSGQLRYHGKHRYLSTAELRAGHNYYKIQFSHINYYLQLVINYRYLEGNKLSMDLSITYISIKKKKKEFNISLG